MNEEEKITFREGTEVGSKVRCVPLLFHEGHCRTVEYVNAQYPGDWAKKTDGQRESPFLPDFQRREETRRERRKAAPARGYLLRGGSRRSAARQPTWIRRGLRRARWTTAELS